MLVVKRYVEKYRASSAASRTMKGVIPDLAPELIIADELYEFVQICLESMKCRKKRLDKTQQSLRDLSVRPEQ